MRNNVKYYRLFVVCLLQAVLVSCANKTNKNSPALISLDTRITSWVDAGYYDGASVAVIKDGLSFFEANYGNYTDTTVLHVASAGKWIAAATIAAIVDEGKLSWDDKVSKFIPEFTDLKGEATLCQLLSHTAGYPAYQPQNRKRDDYQTLEESVRNIIVLPIDTLPGTKFQYGGLAMQVAGRMAEITTGKDWESLFQEKIAIPLHMTHSHFTPVSDEGGFNPMLGGGFRTCRRDYMNFLEMFFNKGSYKGKRVLSEESIRRIEADQVKNAVVNQPEYVFNARQNSHNGIYGLGLWREEIDNDGKAIIISSPGWAGTYPWIDRKHNVYGFIIAKANVKVCNDAGFSSFYGSAVLPLFVRDAIKQLNNPQYDTKRYAE